MSETTSTNGTAANGSKPDEADEPERLRLGGMALRNGLLIHGPRTWAVAARNNDGEIEVASGPKPSLARGKLGTTPMLRGPLRLAEAMAVLPLARSSLRSARLPFEDRGVIAASLASLALSGLLRRWRPAGVGRELAVSIIGTLPALSALRDPALASYHAVEHKAISGYEQGRAPEEVPKEHERCGSNLIGPMMLFSITGQVLTEKFAPDAGPLTRGLAAVAGIGAAVELFAYAERNPDSALGHAVHGPGYEIQRLVSTREPTAEQLEVGVAALDEVLRAEDEAADKA